MKGTLADELKKGPQTLQLVPDRPSVKVLPNSTIVFFCLTLYSVSGQLLF